MAYLIWQRINLPTQFTNAFMSQIAVPEPLIDDVNVYLRGPFTHHLLSLDDPWKSDD